MQKKVLLRWFILCLFSALSGALSAANTAKPYPVRPITLVLPFTASSDTATIARNLAEYITPYFDSQALTITPRPGASGSTAALFVRNAPPDGYTLLLGRASTQAVAPAIDPQLAYRSKDFTLLGMIQMSPVLCAVRSDSPYKTARELLAGIRKQPGSFKYSDSGPGTLLNIASKYMLFLSGLKTDAAIALHFGDGPKANQALLDGQVQFVCNLSTSLIPHLKSGALRGLFTTSSARMDQLPKLQNAREIGLRDMEGIIGWAAILGPANLPKPVVTRWQKALDQLANDPGWLAGIARLGEVPLIKTQKNSNQFIQEQTTFYEKLSIILTLRE